MADRPIFDKDNRLSDRANRMSRRELIGIVDKLCGIVAEQSYETGFRGGIRPDNISIGEDGSISIGPGGRSEKDKWTAEELEFMSPEEFWNGSVGSGADVYAIGLVLYYCVSGGKLPFQTDKTAPEAADRAETLRRRMSGEPVKAPKGSGKALGAIIEKATAFKAEDRYRSVSQITPELAACLHGLDTVTPPDSKKIFNKPEDELSDVEKMMVGIIGRAAEDDVLSGEEAPEEAAETEPADDIDFDEAGKPVDAEPKENTEFCATEEPVAEIPQQEVPVDNAKEAPVDAVNAAEPAETEDEDEPTVKVNPPAPEKKAAPRTTATPAVQYNTGKKKAPQKPQKKKKSKAPVIVALALCAAIIVAAIVIKSFVGDKTPAPTPTPADTAEPSAEVTPTPTPTPAEPTYEVIMSDMSWTAAEKACEDKGGHLVVINDKAEYDKVTAMAAQKGARFVWLGCQRIESGDFAWVTGEKVTFYKWAQGEPSGAESDGTPENYVILWNTEKDLSGDWEYNDVGNDPVSIYPKGYSGKICYICEID